MEIEEINDIIDKWWDIQDEGDVDKYGVGYVKIYPDDLEDLKKRIKEASK